MSKISDNDIDIHSNVIAHLKKEFINLYKTDKSSADDILKKMRITHGYAIYDDEVLKKNLLGKNRNSINDSEWIKLSINSSQLHVMHCNIRKCDKLAYAHKKGLSKYALTTDSDMKSTSSTLSQSPSQTKIDKQPTTKSTKTSFSNAINTKKENMDSIKTGAQTNPATTNKSTVATQENKIKTVVKSSQPGIEEISLQNITTENIPLEKINMDDLFSEVETALEHSNIWEQSSQYNLPVKEQGNIWEQSPQDNLPIKGQGNIWEQSPQDNLPIKGQGNLNVSGGYEMNTTEYFDNINTTEAERLVADYDKNFRNKEQKGGTEYDINKPTLINYWANWCPASQKFIPEWENFKRISSKEFPELQIMDVDGAVYPELVKKSGVKDGIKGYPTIVLYYNGTTYPRVGYAKSNDIIKFVKNIIH